MWQLYELVDGDLLSGIRFTIRTDHRNLLYLNNHGSRKVFQWKLDIQHYDDIIEHIPGEENIPADVFSRLVPKPTDATLNEILVQCTDAQRVLIKENHEWLHAHSGVDRKPYYTWRNVILWRHQRINGQPFVRMFDNISPAVSHVRKWWQEIKSFEHRDLFLRLLSRCKASPWMFLAAWSQNQPTRHLTKSWFSVPSGLNRRT